MPSDLPVDGSRESARDEQADEQADEHFVPLPDGRRICYETFGPKDGIPVLLVAGLGGQLTSWRQDLVCEPLAKLGYYVIRFDNRDVGKSTYMRALGVPSGLKLYLSLMFNDVAPAIAAILSMRLGVHGFFMRNALTMLAATAGFVASRALPQLTPECPYTLSGMAADAVAVLDHLRVQRACVWGVSMGGMIAQLIALDHPERCRALVLLMTTSKFSVWSPTPIFYLRFLLAMTPSSQAKSQIVAAGVRVMQLISTPDTCNKTRATALMEEYYVRQPDKSGSGRQSAAVMAAPSRLKRLATELDTEKIPTTVMHGDQDPLIPVSHGLELASAIPGAKLMVLEGMGHSLPPGAFTERMVAEAHAVFSKTRRPPLRKAETKTNTKTKKGNL